MYISIFIIFGYNVFCSLTDVMCFFFFFFFIYESSSLVKHLVNSFMGVPNHKKIKFYLQKQKYGLALKHILMSPGLCKLKRSLSILKYVGKELTTKGFNFIYQLFLCVISFTYRKMSSITRPVRTFRRNWFLFSLQQLSICK